MIMKKRGNEEVERGGGGGSGGLDLVGGRNGREAAAKQDAPGNKKPRRETLESKLLAAWRTLPRPRPRLKEVEEAFAFFRAVCDDVAGRFRRGEEDTERRTVVDACGGHGLLGMLFVAYRRAHTAVIVDVQRPASFDNLRARLVEQGFFREGQGGFVCLFVCLLVCLFVCLLACLLACTCIVDLLTPTLVTFVQGRIQEHLPRYLSGQVPFDGVEGEAPRRQTYAVVACHACQYLTKEIVDIVTDPKHAPPSVDGGSSGGGGGGGGGREGRLCYPCAVMSCCPKDKTQRIKHAAKAVSLTSQSM